MAYPKTPDFKLIGDHIKLYSDLKHEYGAKSIARSLHRIDASLNKALKEIQRLVVDPRLAQKEPNRLSLIKKLRPNGPRRMWKQLDPHVYADKIEGALLARMAGCTLGAIVEGWTVKAMQEWAKEIGDPFPPVDYWSKAKNPTGKRYGGSTQASYTRSEMNGVPVDDDIIYTLLGLLVAEDYGPNFTIEENGRAWLKYLPHACTAEWVALENLKKGISARKAGERDNPFCEWIGADIRSDPWGYMAPGWPEKAADMAYRDAYLSHRRNGIYGEMYFSAVIAAAFTVEDPVEALKIGLSEIPKDCSLAKAIRWALRVGKGMHHYREARTAVDKRFAGMQGVHTINNACLTIFGLMIGGTDVTKVISQTVAMGLDNDCTTATAGSIVGAVVGKSSIPKHWYRRFNNTVHSYLIGKKKFTITGLVKRFSKQASLILSQKR